MSIVRAAYVNEPNVAVLYAYVDRNEWRYKYELYDSGKTTEISIPDKAFLFSSLTCFNGKTYLGGYVYENQKNFATQWVDGKIEDVSGGEEYTEIKFLYSTESNFYQANWYADGVRTSKNGTILYDFKCGEVFEPKDWCVVER